ncbi:MAG: TonB family protein [Lentimicrobium sp.]|nr:TonB family protein [Lentimicrobium sp.]
METRKTKRADLEKKRPVFLQLGFIVALGAALAAFEWKTPDTGTIVLPPRTTGVIEQEIIPVIIEKKEAPKPVNTTQLKQVSDLIEDLPDIEIKTEADPDDMVLPEIYKPVLPDEPQDENSDPFMVVEIMPEFPGGIAALHAYLYENIEYPRMAREAGISGIVYLSFVVGTDGKLSDISVLRGVGGGCTEEAIRVVKAMPAWKPGIQRSKAVKVKMTLPISFKLVNS